jgi:rhamnosyltransferase
MSPGDVLAVVVSYEGARKIRRTVDALRGQVGRILLVDNGSGAETLGVLASLEHHPDVVVVRLGENRGIGYALNRGVQYARDGGYRWLLTMDQDSVADVAMVEHYRQAVAAQPDAVCLAPTRSDAREAPGTAVSEIRYAITSGNLVRVDMFDLVGRYDEGLFIDAVDFDFSLRLRRAGKAIHRVAGAAMQHQLGEESTSRSLPWVGRFYALHPPARRYYMYRNYLYIVERYFRAFPSFIVRLTVAQLILTVLIAFLDPSPRDSYRAIARGIRDYAARRDGPLIQHA